MLDCTSNKSNLPEKYNRERVRGAEGETTRNLWITLSEPVKRVARWVALN